MKRHCPSTILLQPFCVDRLTSLPDELLGHILSLLPTKDVAAMQLLSKRMGRVFSLITSVDLDDSPICHSSKHPHLVERFPLFKSFVIKVLQNIYEFGEGLTRFRLRFGGDKTTERSWWNNREQASLPYLNPACVNAWISHPLAHSGACLRELDLTFHIRTPNVCKLPPQLFDCRSLESFRLDANIQIDGSDIPLVICLPKLKLVHIHSVIFSEDEFVTRFASSCPALEDLAINYCWWEKMDRVTISSHSLRRLALTLCKRYEEGKISELVLINTPNLQYLSFGDDLPYEYSVSHMNALVEASLDISGDTFDDPNSSFRIHLSFLTALSAVQHLRLHGTSLKIISRAADKDRLPVFRNLRTLKLVMCHGCRWDIIMWLILQSSLLLETLVFPMGLTYSSTNDMGEVYLETEGWRTNRMLSSCCLTHLKRIEFGRCLGIERELNMIKFILGKAPALKELMLKHFTHPSGGQFHKPDFEEFVRKLEELPRASNSCSIVVHR